MNPAGISCLQSSISLILFSFFVRVCTNYCFCSASLFTQRLNSHFVRMRHLSHFNCVNKMLVINSNNYYLNTELFIYTFVCQISVATPNKLKTQDWAITKPRKPKVKFLYVFGKFLEKIALFLKKSKLFLKKCLFIRQNFLMTFFLVISDFQIFYPDFSDFSPKIYFRANFKKNKKNPRSFRKP